MNSKKYEPLVPIQFESTRILEVYREFLIGQVTSGHISKAEMGHRLKRAQTLNQCIQKMELNVWHLVMQWEEEPITEPGPTLFDKV